MTRVAEISLSILLFALTVAMASAKDTPLFTGENYGSFVFFEDVPNTLFFESKIVENDSFEFRRAVRNHNVDTVVLTSPGGSIWEGLTIAGMIFDKKLTTYVPSGGRCASACAFMFFAGDQRKASGKVGVHQFYSDDPEKSDKIGKVEYGSQFTVSEIIGFLNEFGTPPFVFERMFSQQRMYYFSSAEVQKLNSVITEETKLTQFRKIDEFLTKAFDKLEKRGAPDADETEPKVPEPKIDVKELQPEKVIPSDTATTEETKLKFKKLIQAELNRVGCKLGKVDGIIGPASKRALVRFNKYNKSNFEAEKFFTEDENLKLLKGKTTGFCPKIKRSSSVAQKFQHERKCYLLNFAFQFVQKSKYSFSVELAKKHNYIEIQFSNGDYAVVKKLPSGKVETKYLDYTSKFKNYQAPIIYESRGYHSDREVFFYSGGECRIRNCYCTDHVRW